MTTPDPGSDKARKLGCTCPVLDNAHGKGAWGTTGKGRLYWFNEHCKVHHPIKKEEEMKPPWLKFPDIHKASIGWRMGGGEDYIDKWHVFWRKLSYEEQVVYIGIYPPPDGWRVDVDGISWF